MTKRRVRVDAELFERARVEGERHGRTADEQFELWVRAGRDFEEKLEEAKRMLQ